MKRLLLIILCILLSIAAAGCSSQTQQDAYSDNMSILTNPAAPHAGDADISAITGYTESIPDELQLPYDIPDTDIRIVSVGSYTGGYIEDKSGDKCSDVPAVIIRNTGDMVISYACITVKYGDGEDDTTSFIPTNIPAGCCAAVLSSDKELSVKDMKSFDIAGASQILSDKLTVLEGKAGVSYEDGAFIVTNLTDGDLGEVYIRYKYITPGNCYLGGLTCTVNTEPLAAHATQKLYVSFDVENCAIIAVESIKV